MSLSPLSRRAESAASASRFTPWPSTCAVCVDSRAPLNELHQDRKPVLCSTDALSDLPKSFQAASCKEAVDLTQRRDEGQGCVCLSDWILLIHQHTHTARRAWADFAILKVPRVLWIGVTFLVCFSLELWLHRARGSAGYCFNNHEAELCYTWLGKQKHCLEYKINCLLSAAI